MLNSIRCAILAATLGVAVLAQDTDTRRVSFRVRFPASPDQTTVLLGREQIDVRDAVGWWFRAETDGGWSWTLDDGLREWRFAPAGARLPIGDGRWHRLTVAFHRGREDARLWYDGRLVAVLSLDGLLPFRGEFRARRCDDCEIEDVVVTNVADAGMPDPEAPAAPAPEASEGVATVMPDPIDLRVLSWNLDAGRGYSAGEFSATADAIRATGADVVLLQACHGLSAPLADALDFALFERSANVAILSRYPFGDTVVTRRPFRTGAVRVELAPRFTVTVTCVGFGPSDWYPAVSAGRATADSLLADEHRARLPEGRDLLADLTAAIARADKTPVIVGGDFGSPSHLDWGEAAAERHGGLVVSWPVSREFANQRFVDVYRELHPDPAGRSGMTWGPEGSDAPLARTDRVYATGARLTIREVRTVDARRLGVPSPHDAILMSLSIAPAEQ